MRPFFRILSLVLAVLLCLGVQTAYAAEPPQTEDPQGYIVRLKDDAVMPMHLMRSASGDAKPIPYAEGFYKAESLEDVQNLIDAGLVEYVSPDYELTLLEDTADPYANTSWQWYLDMLEVSEAWNDGLTGNGVKVAVIDSGIYKQHEDLDYTRISGYSFLGLPENFESYDDRTGHGTLVTGIIAAQTGNGKGIAGLAEDVNILSLRCFSNNAAGGYNSGSGTVSVVLSAIGYAMEQGADVINMSFGGTDAKVLKPLEEKLIEAAEMGIILVASSGNSGNNTLYYPAAFDCVIGVGSVDSNEVVADHSQRNSSVFVTAPGKGIFGLGYTDTTSYRTDSGTSFAAPMVSALAAMVKQKDKSINNEGFKTLLKSSVTDKGVEGYDTSYGHGLIHSGKLAEVLEKEYKIIYKDGANLLEVYPAIYTIGSTTNLPTPSKEGHTFDGWYDNTAFTGSRIESVPAGSVGDVTYYAKWQVATQPENLAPVAEVETQVGTAIPASYDGITTAVHYTADISSWFLDENDDALTYHATIDNGSGTVRISDKTLTYIPNPADATKTATLKVKAYDGKLYSDEITVSISVGDIPVSNTVYVPENITYDRFTDGALGVTVHLGLFGNTLDMVKNGDTLLNSEDYQLTSEPTIDGWPITIKADYLAQLSVGNHTLTFRFIVGEDKVEKIVTLTITDSTPVYTVRFVSDSVEVTNRSVNHGIAIGSEWPDDPQKDGNTFGGWFTETDSEVTASTAVTDALSPVEGVITLYAKWIAAGGGDIGDGGAPGGGDTGGGGTPGGGNTGGGGAPGGGDTGGGGGLPEGGENGGDDEETPELETLWENPFGDIQTDSWFYDSVKFVSEKGLFKGVTETDFAPDIGMTRAMLVTVLHRLAGTPQGESSPFSDVPGDNWFTDAVSWAAEVGIVTGTGSGFMPDVSITREQLITMLYRYAVMAVNIEVNPGTAFAGFADAADVSSWAADAMSWAVESGIMEGKPDNRIDPQGGATRAEVSVLLHRFAELYLN